MSSPGGGFSQPQQQRVAPPGDPNYPPTYRPSYQQHHARPPVPSSMPAPQRPLNAPHPPPPQHGPGSAPPRPHMVDPMQTSASVDHSRPPQKQTGPPPAGPTAPMTRPQVYRPAPIPSTTPVAMTEPMNLRPSGPPPPLSNAPPFQTAAHEDARSSRRKYPEEIARAYDPQLSVNPSQSSNVYKSAPGALNYPQSQIPPAYPTAGPHQYPPPPLPSPPTPPSLYASQPPASGLITPADALGGGGFRVPSGVSTVPDQPPGSTGFLPGTQGYGVSKPGFQPPYTDGTQQQLAGLTSSRSFASLNLLATQLNLAEVKDFPHIKLPPQIAQGLTATANCPYAYQRCTFNAIPQTNSLLSKSKLPFGLVVSPFRSIDKNEEPVPVSTSASIVRCRYCRAYINPFVTFVGSEPRWKCNICSRNNDLPSDFDYDISTQRHVDRSQKVELTHGIVEFVASPEYMVRPPQPPAYFFIIDVSSPSVTSGMVAAACQVIQECLDDIPNEDGRTRIGFMTVDSTLHFYSLDPSLTQPRMLVVSDLEDVFLPQPEDLLANLSESKSSAKTLLEQIPEIFKSTHNPQNVLGPALQSPVGGKIIVLQGILPSLGEGALRNREDSKLFGTPKESTLLEPSIPFYKNMALQCSPAQITVDLFLFPTQYIDVATLSSISRYTGGNLYFYPGFNSSRTEDITKFGTDMCRFLGNPLGLEAVLRVRATKGLRMCNFHGSFFLRSSDLLSLPTVNLDGSYGIQVAIDEELSSSVVCFQTALLYTTCFGERRIRVMTQVLPVTNSLSQLYESADALTITAMFAKAAVDKVRSYKLDDARDFIINKCVEIFNVYRSSLTTNLQGAQLLICENLRFLPLFILGLIKSPAFRAGTTTPSDVRAYSLELMNTLNSTSLANYICPELYALHRLEPHMGRLNEAQSVTMPPPLNLSSEILERHGIYLLSDGLSLYIYIGRNVSPDLCISLFDVPNYEAVMQGRYTLPLLKNEFSERVNAIIETICDSLPNHPYLFLVKEDGDPIWRMAFLSKLIEDRTDVAMSYRQFVTFLRGKLNPGS